jgi:diaminohydroxyphosphoribosylaminopyrimidine deaminase/5-amino-6-(5-phosphoribosylamino)uracil reductase
MLTHQQYMQQVLNLAELMVVQTRPNPKVAAIVVKNNQVVGIGTHLQAGKAHAEVFALAQAGENAHDATLYVNLEPCSHSGRTPPCVEQVIKAGIKQVVIANLDPNPLVAGNGIKRLEQAGIEVITGVLEDQAWELNEVFFHNIQTNLPYISLKVGMSLDGRIATKTNSSKWITATKARVDAHYYRQTHEAILVGIGTVLADNPSLTPHLLAKPSRYPIRIILDPKLRTPLNCHLVADQLAPTWIITQIAQPERHYPYQQFGCRIIYLATANIREILSYLYQQQIWSILVEGGEGVYSSLIDAKCVNQIISYISPQLIGSTQAKHLFAGSGFADLENNLKLKFCHLTQLGDDIKLIAKVI